VELRERPGVYSIRSQPAQSRRFALSHQYRLHADRTKWLAVIGERPKRVYRDIHALPLERIEDPPTVFTIMSVAIEPHRFQCLRELSEIWLTRRQRRCLRTGNRIKHQIHTRTDLTDRHPLDTECPVALTCSPRLVR